MSTESSNTNFKQLAKSLSFVENDIEGSSEFLASLELQKATKIVGITGPPGAGKSTLVNALLEQWTRDNKRIAILSVDPSSPFNFGALLGDRIRMSSFYTHPNVFIRSVATRGNLGGLSARIIEMTDVLRASNFDYIVLETVGVGQSEVEIAGIADTTIVVLVPEAGDEVQSMKAGLMEIADIFVVNKSDRPGADAFVKNLKLLVHNSKSEWEIPVIKTIATGSEGIEEIQIAIEDHHSSNHETENRKNELLLLKAWQLLEERKMKTIDKKKFNDSLLKNSSATDFNLYRWIDTWV